MGKLNTPPRRWSVPPRFGGLNASPLRNDRTSPLSRRLLNDIAPYLGMLRQPRIESRFISLSNVVNARIQAPTKLVTIVDRQPKYQRGKIVALLEQVIRAESVFLATFDEFPKQRHVENPLRNERLVFALPEQIALCRFLS